MSKSSVGKSGGVGLGTVLFLLFLVLKLTHTIDWPWWLVTVPLWWPLPVLAICALIIGAVHIAERNDK